VDFLGRFAGTGPARVEVRPDGGVIVSAPADHPGPVHFAFRDDDLPAPGRRAVAFDITILEAGDRPGFPAGLGLVQGLREDAPGTPFAVGLVSPRDGGSLSVGRFTGAGFSLQRAPAGDGTGAEDRQDRTVRLALNEQDGRLVFSLTDGASGRTGATVEAAASPAGGLGLILVAGGTYRIDNLTIEATD
jgi:hypothetical protein